MQKAVLMFVQSGNQSVLGTAQLLWLLSWAVSASALDVSLMQCSLSGLVLCLLPCRCRAGLGDPVLSLIAGSPPCSLETPELVTQLPGGRADSVASDDVNRVSVWRLS